MRDTIFGVTDMKRLAVPYADGKSGPVRMGEPQIMRRRSGDGHRASRRRASSIRNPISQAARVLPGTADDFMKFLEALRSGGEPILKRETLAMASRNHIGDLPRETEARAGALASCRRSWPIRPRRRARSPSARSNGAAPGATAGSSTRPRGISVVDLTNTASEGVSGAYPKEM